MILGVVIPTVPGREGNLRRALDSHGGTFYLGGKIVIQVERGHETCGDAWNAGARALRENYGTALEYLCFSADDLVAWPEWWREAVETVDAGELPAPRLYLTEPGGTITAAGPRANHVHIRDPRTNDGEAGELVAIPRVPFFRFETWLELGPCPSLHYYSDVWYGDRAAALGIPVRLRAGFAFTHEWAEPGRIHDASRDRALYERLKAS